MDTWIWVALLIVLAVILVGAAVIGGMRANSQRRSARLRDRFGPEYDNALQRHGSRKDAERDLASRSERVKKLQLKNISPEQRSKFGEQWQSAQTRFVDDPRGAVADAQRSVDEAMQARGFPLGELDQRAADISVEHPYVVENYRAALLIAEADRRGEADTEQLRQAMVHYRELFRDLLNTPGGATVSQEQGRPRQQQPRGV